jgi:hypothetical protein
MRKISLLFVLLVLLSGLSFGQDNSLILKFDPPIKDKEVSLSRFLKLVKQNTVFCDSLDKRLGNSNGYRLANAPTNVRDSSVTLTLTLDIYQNLPEVEDVSLESLLQMLKDNENKPFYEGLKGKVTDTNPAPTITTDSTAATYYRDSSIINYLTKNEAASEKVRNAINPFHIRYWWAWILLTTLLTALLSLLAIKKYIKMNIERLVLDHINEHLDNKEFDKYKSIEKVIEKLRSSQQRKPEESTELIIKKYRDAIKESEEKLSQWVDIADKTSPKEVREFLSKNGFYDNNVEVFQKGLKTRTFLYFSDVNMGNDGMGVLYDENKTSAKTSDTQYELELSENNKAFFKLLDTEDAQRAVLAYPYFKLDPFCTVLNDGSPTKKIITKDYGLAELEGDKWVVKEKAKVRYV